MKCSSLQSSFLVAFESFVIPIRTSETAKQCLGRANSHSLLVMLGNRSLSRQESLPVDKKHPFSRFKHIIGIFSHYYQTL